MAAGFECYYNGQAIQITNELRAFSLIKSGVLYDSDFILFGQSNSDQQAQRTATAYVDLPKSYPYTEAIIFFRNNNPAANGRVTAKVINGVVRINKWWNLSVGTQGVSYYVFARCIRPGGTSGLQLWDGQGDKAENLMFDSSWYCLQIKKAYVLPVNTPQLSSATNATYTITDNTLLSTDAICIPAARIALYTEKSLTVVLQECAWVTTNTINLNFVAIDGTSYAVFNPTNYCNTGNGFVLVADMSAMPMPYSI